MAEVKTKVAIRITYPTEGQPVTTKFFEIRGTAPSGSTVYYMEYTKGFRDTKGPEIREWQYPICVKAKADNTFVFPNLVNGTGQGDNKTHKVFVNVGGKEDGIKIIGGTDSNTVQFTHEPKEEAGNG